MTLAQYFSNIPHSGERRQVRIKLAKKIGVSENSVYSWISGIRNPTPENARAIERELKGKVKKEELRPDIYRGE